MAGQQRCTALKIVLAVLGVVSGITIFASFIALKNINAAVWGMLSAVFAAVVLRLHTSYARRRLHLRFTPECLRIVKIFGIVLSVASIAATVTYFILAAHFNQGYKIEDDGYAPAAIFALLSLKWTFMMFWEGRKYEIFLRASTSTEIASISSGDYNSQYNN